MISIHYRGGKGQVFQKLINLIPPHEVYIETHLGGGAIIRNKRPATRNIGIEIDPKVLEMWAPIRVKEIEIVHGDAVSFLKSYPFTGKEFVYCDPPYLRNTRKGGRRLYRYEYTLEQHGELLKKIKSLPCMVMISGYESELYTASLKGWNTHSFQSATHNGMAQEWVWMNYPTPVELHDYRYLGNTFRERERIKMKSKRWKARLKSMPVLERQALLFAIQSSKSSL